jgi:hypothetical protein
MDNKFFCPKHELEREKERGVRCLTVGVGGRGGHLGDDSVPVVVSKLDEEWATVSKQVAVVALPAASALPRSVGLGQSVGIVAVAINLVSSALAPTSLL